MKVPDHIEEVKKFRLSDLLLNKNRDKPISEEFLIETVKEELGYGDPKTDGVIADAFLYAWKNCYKDKERRTGELFLVHPVDMALRNRYLQMEPLVIVCNLLHDVVEEKEGDIFEKDNVLKDIKSKFGSEIAENVEVLTNKYALLLDDVLHELSKKVSIGELYNTISSELKNKNYENTIFLDAQTKLIGYLDSHKVENEKIVHKSIGHLKLAVYKDLYLRDLVEYAITTKESGILYVQPLIGKNSDTIDNSRKIDTFSKPNLEKTVEKAESVLNVTDKLIKDGDAIFVETYETRILAEYFSLAAAHFAHSLFELRQEKHGDTIHADFIEYVNLKSREWNERIGIKEWSPTETLSYLMSGENAELKSFYEQCDPPEQQDVIALIPKWQVRKAIIDCVNNAYDAIINRNKNHAKKVLETKQ